MGIKRWLQWGVAAGLFCAVSLLSAAELTDYGPVTKSTSTIQRPGTVVWMDLLTPDVQKAAQFYSTVFGWKFAFSPEGDYAYATLDGKPVASLVKLDGESKGAFGLWLPSIAVSDVNTTLTTLARNGGSVVKGPEVLPGRGRYALVKDPSGAVFMVLRANTGDPQRSESNGTWVWDELWTDNISAATGFYQSLFGYHAFTYKDGNHGNYQIMGRNGAPLTGIVKRPLPKVEPGWLGYLQVENVDATARQVLKAGGAVLLPPKPGTQNEDIAIVADPTGGVFALQQKEAR